MLLYSKIFQRLGFFLAFIFLILSEINAQDSLDVAEGKKEQLSQKAYYPGTLIPRKLEWSLR